MWNKTTTPKHRSTGLIRLIWQQNGNVSGRRRAQIKQLAWPMAERQIGDRNSSLVVSARFPVVKWRSPSVDKSAYYLPLDSPSLRIWD